MDSFIDFNYVEKGSIAKIIIDGLTYEKSLDSLTSDILKFKVQGFLLGVDISKNRRSLEYIDKIRVTPSRGVEIVVNGHVSSGNSLFSFM